MVPGRFYGPMPSSLVCIMPGVVHVGKKNVNLEMVKAGLAEVYRGKPPKGFDSTPYLSAEAQAQTARRGVWSQEKNMSPGGIKKAEKEIISNSARKSEISDSFLSTVKFL